MGAFNERSFNSQTETTKFRTKNTFFLALLSRFMKFYSAYCDPPFNTDRFLDFVRIKGRVPMAQKMPLFLTR